MLVIEVILKKHQAKLEKKTHKANHNLLQKIFKVFWKIMSIIFFFFLLGKFWILNVKMLKFKKCIILLDRYYYWREEMIVKLSKVGEQKRD